METSLQEIIKNNPNSRGMNELMNILGYQCSSENWKEVYKSLTLEQQTKFVDMKTVLRTSTEDTLTILKANEEKLYLRICADIVESIAYIYKEDTTWNLRFRNVIEGIRNYCNGAITREELDTLRDETKAFVSASYSVSISIQPSFLRAMTSAVAAIRTEAAANIPLKIANKAVQLYACEIATGINNAECSSDRKCAAACNTAHSEQWEKNYEIIEKYLNFPLELLEKV